MLALLAITVLAAVLAGSVDDRVSVRGVAGGVGATLGGCLGLLVLRSLWNSSAPVAIGDDDSTVALRALPSGLTATTFTGATLLSSEVDNLTPMSQAWSTPTLVLGGVALLAWLLTCTTALWARPRALVMPSVRPGAERP